MSQVVTLLNLLNILLLSSVSTASTSAQLKLKTNLQNSNDDIDDMAGVNSKLSRGEKLSTVKLQQKNKRTSPSDDLGKNEVIELEMEFCRPYPSIVKIEEPGDWGKLYYPSFVELYRCAGGCYVSLNEESVQCTMTRQKNLTILVKNIATKVEVKIPMSNHTACQCRCVTRKCNAGQRYDDKECSCKCIKDGSHCKEEDNKRWNTQLCKCECYNPLFCDLGETWNSDSCKCEPDDTISARAL